MGIPEMLAQSKDSGGMEGFFNSPIAMILMPRTAARFQEAKKDQMLLAQYQRKVELAGKFADQIESQDPQAAAMIRADPSAMDNVWSAWYSANKQKELAKQGFQYDIAKQQNQSELALKLKEAESMLPGGVGAHQATMGKFLEDSVATKTQGPNKPGLPTAGEVASQNIDPKRMTLALSEDYGLPDLTPGNALRIMQQPAAAEELQDNRRANLEMGKTTTEVVIDGKKVKLAVDPSTGKFTEVVGTVPKTAEELKLEAGIQTRRGPDGQNHDYGYEDGKGYTKDLGLTKKERDPNIGKHVEKFVDGKKRIMLWSEKDQDYTKDIGEAPPSGGYTVGVDKEGNPVITYGSTGGAPKGPTEAQQKGISLWEGARDQYTTAIDNFDALIQPRNATAASLGKVGRAAMTEDGQAAYDAVQQVAQNYIYALSGQQAPDSEVERIMSLVMPNIQDYPKAKRNKKILLHSMMRAIEARLPEKYKEGVLDKEGKPVPVSAEDRDSAPLNKDLKVPLPDTTPPPMPQLFKDKGYTQEQWDNLDPEDWDAFKGVK